MGAFAVYILKSSLLLALLVSLFMIFMSRETFHKLNRYVMLSLIFLSLSLPLVDAGIENPLAGAFAAVEDSFTDKRVVVQHAAGSTETKKETVELEAGQYPDFSEQVPLISFDDMAADAASAQMVFLPETSNPKPQVKETVVVEEAALWIKILFAVYILGVLFLVVRQMAMYVQVARIIMRSRVEDASLYGCEGIKMRVHGGKEKPFSWFRWIVVNENDLEDGAREILIHETAHARSGHSWDIVLADAVIIMQWFNPLAWIMKSSLKDIHEFEADEAVINSGVNAKQYQLLIIKKAVGARLYSIANSFNHSLTKKRITMMCKEKSKKWRCAKALYIVPVAAIAALMFSSVGTANATESETLAKGSENVLNETSSYAENLPAADNNANHSGVHAQADGIEDSAGAKIKAAEMSSSRGDGDVVPQFPGGTDALMKYLASNIKYPEDAKAAGKQGKVYLAFTVKSDGSIANVSVIRSAGHKSLDNEALRVVKAMPKWTPGTKDGKAVDIKYTLPVAFMLPAEKKSNKIAIGDGSVVVDTDIKDKALIVVDGKVYDGDLKDLETSPIAHIEVIKNSALTAELKEKYNAKEYEGIILITTVAGESSSAGDGVKRNVPSDAPFVLFDDDGSAGGEGNVIQICEKMPEFPGGMNELMKWLCGNIKYPKAARDINAQGKVFVKFVVMADGSISNAEVMRCDFSSDYSEVSAAEQMAKEIERGKFTIEVLENDCRDFERHIKDYERKLAVLEKDSVSEKVLNRRREELEEAQKLLEEERARIVKLKRVVAQKEEALAKSRKELDEIVVAAYKNNKGETLSADKAMALRAAAENALKAEAVRVVAAMPKWNPGTEGGKAVNVQFMLPIQFRLR